MKTKSKRGAALAYVIILTAVMMVLASALILTAKYNMDYTRNNLEGRQAYLDAKSAIEYAKAYLAKHPDSGDFAIVKSGSGSAFAVGSSGAVGAVAVYSSKDGIVNAAAKYASSDRVRKLGYQFPQGDEEGTNDFLVAGENYGWNILSYNSLNFSSQEEWISCLFPISFSDLSGDDFLPSTGKKLPDDYWNKVKHVSPYPVFFSKCLSTGFTNRSYTLKAPQILLFGKTNSVLSQANTNLTLDSDVIYIQGDILSARSLIGFDGRQPELTLRHSGRGVVVFKSDCTITKLNAETVGIRAGCYAVENGTDLFSLSNNTRSENYKYKKLRRLDKVPAFAKISRSVEDSPENVISGEEPIFGDSGAGWSFYGSAETPFDLFGSAKGKIVYWYLNDVGYWKYSMGGNKYAYSAKEINLRYVSDNNFLIGRNNTVVFQADSVTLSFSANHRKTELPEIEQSGKSKFRLEGSTKEQIKLFVPEAITVRYRDENGVSCSYKIRAGYYDSVPELNFFSQEAKEFFQKTKPKPYDEGKTNGTGGVYTDGQ